jgi:hypothetical protein
VGAGELPVKEKAEPVIRQQASGEAPVPCRLRVTDCLDRVATLGMPAGGCGMQYGEFAWLGAAQLELQHVGENLMVAKPGPPRVDGDHECAGLLQVLQDPLAARAAGQVVGARTRRFSTVSPAGRSRWSSWPGCAG